MKMITMTMIATMIDDDGNVFKLAAISMMISMTTDHSNDFDDIDDDHVVFEILTITNDFHPQARM